MTTTSLPATAPTTHETLGAMSVHLGALLLAMTTSWILGAAGMLVGAAVLLLRPGNSDFVAEHAREALNFNLSMFLWAALALAFTIGTLGLGLLITIQAALLFAVVWFVCSIMAAVAGHGGKAYRYPLTWRIV